MKLNHSTHGSTNKPVLTGKPEKETNHCLCQTLFSAIAVLASIVTKTGFLTRHFRQDFSQLNSSRESNDIECARFSDQCPITTELGKGIP